MFSHHIPTFLALLTHALEKRRQERNIDQFNHSVGEKYADGKTHISAFEANVSADMPSFSTITATINSKITTERVLGWRIHAGQVAGEVRHTAEKGKAHRDTIRSQRWPHDRIRTSAHHTPTPSADGMTG